MGKEYEILEPLLTNKRMVCVDPDSRLVTLSTCSNAAIAGPISALTSLRPLDSDKYFEIASAYNEVIDMAEASDKIDKSAVFNIRKEFDERCYLKAEEMPEYAVKGSSLPVPSRDEVLNSNYVENVIGKAVYDTKMRAERKSRHEAGLAMFASGASVESTEGLFNWKAPAYVPVASKHLKPTEVSDSYW